MDTTFDLPDALVRQVKVRAVNQGRDLKDTVTDLLRIGLAAAGDSADTLAAQTVKTDPKSELPYIDCPHEALPEDEMTPDRVADLLLKQETDQQHEAG
jgi:hypothetical protein